MCHQRQPHVIGDQRHALTALDSALCFDRFDVHEHAPNAIGTRHGVLHPDLAPRWFATRLALAAHAMALDKRHAVNRCLKILTLQFRKPRFRLLWIG